MPLFLRLRGQTRKERFDQQWRFIFRLSDLNPLSLITSWLLIHPSSKSPISGCPFLRPGAKAGSTCLMISTVCVQYSILSVQHTHTPQTCTDTDQYSTHPSVVDNHANVDHPLVCRTTRNRARPVLLASLSSFRVPSMPASTAHVPSTQEPWRTGDP